MLTPIPFNKPYVTGREAGYIAEVLLSGKLSGDGVFTRQCQQMLEKQYGFQKALLTTSCTDALEMAALLLNIREGDEVIAPSYTFVSTVNAFVLRGARIVFADSNPLNPNIDTDTLESLITPRTRAIVVIHYAGIASDMDKIMNLAHKHGIAVVEDAAAAIHSYYKGTPLGSIGTFGTFSFHETKNISSGEGGVLLLNDPRYFSRAEIIREKGTNRAAFFRGEVNKYGWVDIGSSFLPAEIISAFLYAQLEQITEIQKRRTAHWVAYQELLKPLAQQGLVQLPDIPAYATNNAHAYYLVLKNRTQRTALIEWLKSKNIQTAFHYLALHKSPYFEGKYTGLELKEADRYSDCLLRLPLFYELKTAQIETICQEIKSFLMQHEVSS
ncbi:MAG TPA: dTDP-4-amino-4,6-dideoxygalactose transaminase [Bacteroidia bacterium]|jgi:dTDP-4-amino-4,6-dideoxygalactose transaminase|nr:dTDP-4-amino-4,6-dideoxygalactose transaminase [Bacteroidia bacterium]